MHSMCFNQIYAKKCDNLSGAKNFIRDILVSCDPTQLKRTALKTQFQIERIAQNGDVH